MADLPFIHLIWSQTGNVWMVFAGIWTLWRGGRDERIGAAIFALSWVLSLLTFQPGGASPWLVAIDVAVFVAFAVLTVVTRRLWVFLFAASLLNNVAAHFIGRIAHLGVYAYVTALGIWGGYVPLLILTIAMVNVERRRGSARRPSQPIRSEQGTH